MPPLCGGVSLLLLATVTVAGLEAGAAAQAHTERDTRAASNDADEAHARAAVYLDQGRVAEALPHLERAQALDLTHYASGYDLALAYLQLDRIDDARRQVQRLLAAQPTAELHNLLGNVEERAGRLYDAAEAFQRAAHLDATEAHLFDWGNNLLQLEAFDHAGDVFVAAAARHPDSARLYVGLGIARYSRGQYSEAARAFCRASDLEPADPRPHLFLGEMYGVAPDLAAEITPRLARFVREQPDHALGHYYYAMNLRHGRAAGAEVDPAAIEAALRRATELDASLAQAFLQLGIVLSEQGRHADAVRELRTAVRLDPDLPQSRLRLARAYQRTGEDALAARELEAFRRLQERER